MNRFFNSDSFLYKLLERIADFFLISALTAICCFPIITAGAAITASHKVAQNMVMKNDQPVVKTYFQAFTKNFKQATFFWMLTILVAGVLLANIILIYISFTGNIATILYAVVGFFCGIALGALAYSFPLVARYENTFKQHLRNAFFIAIAMLPRTVGILALTAIPVGVAVYSLELFFETMGIWGIMGFGILVFLQECLICPVFARLEGPKSDEKDGEEESQQDED